MPKGKQRGGRVATWIRALREGCDETTLLLIAVRRTVREVAKTAAEIGAIVTCSGIATLIGNALGLW